MRLKLTGNKPHHGEGEHGKQSRKGGLMAGAHMPLRHAAANGRASKDGAHTGKPGRGDTSRLPAAAKGNSKGTAPPSVNAKLGQRGTPESHMGHSGRGGAGRIGKHDGYKGAPTKYSEDISHESFEKLGSILMRMAPTGGSRAFVGRNGQGYNLDVAEADMPPENVGLAFANGWVQLPIIPDKVPPTALELDARLAALEAAKVA